MQLRSVLNLIKFIAVIFLAFFCAIEAWFVYYFGSTNFEQIMFHLYAPLKGSPTDLIPTLLLPFLFFIFLSTVYFLIRKNSKLKKFFIFGLICIIFFILCFTTGLREYIINQYHASDFIEKNYVDPKTTSITFPKDKKNLIFIVAESMETSLQDVEKGGLLSKNYIPNLSQLALDNLTFSHSEKIQGALVFSNSGWTIAGMVAQTAGIPLKSFGNSFNNSLSSVVSFLPGAYTLGDVLEKNGYHNVFIAGSYTSFAGKNMYMTQHGNYEIYDKFSFEKEFNRNFPIVHDRIIADSELFPRARQKITQLANEAQPFHVLLLTGNTHMTGYLDNDCAAAKESGQHIEKAYKCSDEQISNFVHWIMAQPFYENSVIVIVGDHLNMLAFNDILADVPAFSDYVLHSQTKRKIYNVFINTKEKPLKSTGRKFSTLDIYPTTLAALGAKIEGDRLALGTNLFSDKETLLEKYDYYYLDKEFQKTSNFYMKYLWNE